VNQHDANGCPGCVHSHFLSSLTSFAFDRKILAEIAVNEIRSAIRESSSSDVLSFLGRGIVQLADRQTF